jgi:predicted Zn-dependent protease with MMP-like domain
VPWPAKMEVVPIEMDAGRFDELVSRSLDEIPDELARLVRQVVVLVEDEPPDDQPSDLLGLYHGVPMTEREELMIPTGIPDLIFIFRGPLLRMCHTERELAHEVRVTVLHEVAHHFGIDDARLHDLGFG